MKWIQIQFEMNEEFFRVWFPIKSCGLFGGRAADGIAGSPMVSLPDCYPIAGRHIVSSIDTFHLFQLVMSQVR